MEGFYNKVLVVNLTDESHDIQVMDDTVYQDYLGGKGLAAAMLLKMNPAGCDPLSGDNVLIFATGPVTGSTTWGSSRYGVFSKSPLTGFFLESYSGGRVPEAISATGYDAVVFKGTAGTLRLVEISPQGAVFHDARELKGKDTFETEKQIRQQFKHAYQDRDIKCGSVVIGPAGENRIVFANIKNDGWRCAGRGGAGAIMGAKNIKAVVFRGGEKRSLHDPEAMKRLSKDLSRESRDSPVVQAYKSNGTSQMLKVMNTAGGLPTRYWEQGQCPHWESISAQALHSRCRVTPHACAKCFLACGRRTTVLEGRHAGMDHEGPEYETIYAFGALCMIDTIEEVIYLNRICDAHGMDTITAGNLCAFAMKAREMGKVDFDIAFGDVEKTAQLLEMIVNHQGLGEILARGIIPASKALGMEEEAVHVKGMEPAGYDPRVLKGMGLAYAVSDRGACHLRATVFKPELTGVIDPDAKEGKARLLIDFEDRHVLFDTLILCRFFRDLYPWESLGELIHAACGIDGSKQHLQKVASNIASAVRRFNLQEGLTPEDEMLPPALFRPIKSTGAVIKKQDLEYMLEEYYELRGFENPFENYWDNHFEQNHGCLLPPLGPHG